VFRCETNCAAQPHACVNEELYLAQAAALVKDGYRAAGYATVSIDDCWSSRSRTADGQLVADPARFPHGLPALGAALRQLGVSLGLYLDIGRHTCARYPGSAGHLREDAQMLLAAGATYVKVDGCSEEPRLMARDYTALGRELAALPHPVVFSCSWPAYLAGVAEADKPFRAMRDAGCDLWRNWVDIECSYRSLRRIVDHFGDASEALARNFTGGFNDMDMLIIGAGCLSEAEERTQMAVWSVMAAPLIMGNDLRSVPARSRELLLNRKAIAINQDRSHPGYRVARLATAELWQRELHDSSVAVALVNLASVATNMSLDLGRWFDGQVRVDAVFAAAPAPADPVAGTLVLPVDAHGAELLLLRGRRKKPTTTRYDESSREQLLIVGEKQVSTPS
jgi:hypothetical protein